MKTILPRLQKSDEDTNELIDEITSFLFSIGIRTSKERAWTIFKAMHKIPYELLIKKNPTISYQGAGVHLSSKHGSQLLVVKDVGRFELKGVSMKKGQPKKAVVKFQPSEDIKRLAAEGVEVIDE